VGAASLRARPALRGGLTGGLPPAACGLRLSDPGDYNGTELFGVGTDRFIWLLYKPNKTGTVRLFSENFAKDGLVTFAVGKAPAKRQQNVQWAHFAHGVDRSVISEPPARRCDCFPADGHRPMCSRLRLRLRVCVSVLSVLHREGFKLKNGIDGVMFGNIPGGGMSRSASLCLNLVLSLLDANGAARARRSGSRNPRVTEPCLRR
jgi:galactokinase